MVGHKEACQGVFEEAQDLKTEAVAEVQEDDDGKDDNQTALWNRRVTAVVRTGTGAAPPSPVTAGVLTGGTRMSRVRATPGEERIQRQGSEQWRNPTWDAAVAMRRAAQVNRWGSSGAMREARGDAGRGAQKSRADHTGRRRRKGILSKEGEGSVRAIEGARTQSSAVVRALPAAPTDDGGPDEDGILDPQEDTQLEAQEHKGAKIDDGKATRGRGR